MNKRIMLLGLAAAAIFSGAGALAADQVKAKDLDQQQVQTPRQQTVGSQLMTTEEHKEHRTKMRSATTKEKREKVRTEQHKTMKARAKEQGKVISENPLAGGMGGNANSGNAMSNGMGGEGRMGNGRGGIRR